MRPMKSRATPKRETPAHEEPQGAASKPISLAPLSFEEALDGLLGVKPEPKDEPKKRTVKKTAKK